MAPCDRALLLTLAAEATDARVRLEELAGRAGAWITDLPADARSSAMTELQAFDHLAQRLDAISTLLTGLGRGEDAAALVSEVPLADMAARLAGCRVAAAETSGDLVLFD